MSDFTFATVNATFQRAGDTHGLRSVASLCDVMHIVEARTGGENPKPLQVQTILGPGWDVHQDRSSSARSGSVLAVREGRGLKVRKSHLIKLNEEGNGVQERYLRRSIIHVIAPNILIEDAVFHLPVEKTGKQDDAEKRVAQWRNRAAKRRRQDGRLILMGADVNQPCQEFANDLRLPDWFGKMPMFMGWGNGWNIGAEYARTYSEFDHKVLFLRAMLP